MPRETYERRPEWWPDWYPIREPGNPAGHDTLSCARDGCHWWMLDPERDVSPLVPLSGP